MPKPYLKVKTAIDSNKGIEIQIGQQRIVLQEREKMKYGKKYC